MNIGIAKITRALVTAAALAASVGCWGEKSPPHDAGGADEVEARVDRLITRLDNEWDPRLRDAGKPQHGRLLSARLMKDPAEPHAPLELLLSVRNVTEEDVIDPFFDPDLNMLLVLVRDEAGRPLRRSRGALARLRRWVAAGMGFGEMLEFLPPGAASGFVYPLGEEYAFDAPGTFTVLASTDWGNRIVASPLVFELREKSVGGQRVLEPVIAAPTAAPRTMEIADPEWLALMENAGKPFRGRVLETAISPDSPGEFHLVVSIVAVPDLCRCAFLP